MAKIAYQSINISPDRLELIQTCNEIIREYQQDDLMLTLRQLYYQLVSRDVIANRVQEYKRLGDVVNAARLAGLMDWSAIEDRTRNLVYGAHWDNPESILAACASQFRVDRWEDQDVHIDVWVEKEALSGVFERICRTMDVGCFACRGYTSQSEMWAASQRFLEHIRNGKSVVILHFGDHDPSGIDMSRDIEDRLRMFLSHHLGSARVDEAFVVKRLALNMDQVRRYQPPENPAKSTDSRFASYHATYGDKSWELDALNPRTLQALVREHVMELCDKDLWEDIITREAEARGQLRTMTAHYTEILEHMMEDKNLSSSLTEHVDEARTRITDELNGGADEGDE